MSIDQEKEVFDKLYPVWVADKGKIETEQDARLQIINCILIEVLSWEYENIKTEPHDDSGFFDYLLMSGGRGRFIVEAKRLNKILIDTKNPKYSSY